MNIRSGFIRLLILLSILATLGGCGRKGPPTLPEKPSSSIQARANALVHNASIIRACEML